MGEKNDRIVVDKSQRHTFRGQSLRVTSGEAVFLCLNVKVWIPCRLGVKNTKVLPIQHEIREFLIQNFL